MARLSVGEALTNRRDVHLATERRVHLRVRVVVPDRLVGQHQVVRRDLGRHARAVLLGAADDVHSPPGGDVGHVQVAAGGPGQLDAFRELVIVGVRITEGVDPDDGHGPGVFQGLVIDGLFLDLAALVTGFHGAQHAAAFGDAVEFGQNGLFHQVGEFVHDEAALLGIFIFRQAPLPVDDHLDGQGTAYRFT